MFTLLAGKSPSSRHVSNIWLLWQETHLAPWPVSIATAQPSVQFLCLCWINLHLTYISPTKQPKVLVFGTDVSNPRSQVRVTCSVRVGLLSIMGTHNCVLSTICRNFCPCPRLTSKEATHFSGRICWYSGETATRRESDHHEYDHKSELVSCQVIIDLFRHNPFMLNVKWNEIK
jgi:hypothetical protein